ncbi:MAG: hypothetical protein A2207_02310 [Candidatus Yanofskybacteria bacterium RIFOXYA1_FULL_44_17]|nr:MAG: hypothetical protein A2207_02310 [Candidatus Yanofskybacteria bacterium RIFOXYA1_FULL_44_17]OGN38980.1 MAG: hypothetical protein A2302_01525 [Candidatus Yanofskybacteria bacterium RIFOXYB2_FULL_44_18]HBT80409.1 hypothetical protein [Candidatus Yanofskybacteria bacterium]
MIISKEQIKKMRELYRKIYGKDFESDLEAEEHLRTLCQLFSWLIKNQAKKEATNKPCNK